VGRTIFRTAVITLIALAATIAAVVFSSSNVPLRSKALREKIITSLSGRLNSDVSIGDLSWRLYPRLRAEGKDLVIRERGRREGPPLISIQRFAVDGDLLRLVRKHVAHVELAGLDINIVPHEQEGGPKGTGEPAATSGNDRIGIQNGVTIDTLDTTEARLIINPSKPDKPAKVWAIHTLRMHQVGVDGSMPFEATLTNAIPPGEIKTSGSFGPWDTTEPGDTPLEGTFTFDNADLSVFHGIAGRLSSKGSFGGSLAEIDVHGETTTPDFTIDVGGHPFPLHTVYHSVVDGTNGDTRLERIDADFLQSTLVARGSVLDGPPGEHGRTVTLQIDMPHARIEDVMLMAVKAPKPPLTGALRMTTKFLLPPGETDVADRLKLDGSFTMARVHFTSYNVQAKIDELSHASRGRTRDGARPDSVVSNLGGRFLLGNGRLELRDLTFAAPGAQVKLTGAYALKPETLNFKGTLLMQAKVSETQRGIKKLLLKIVDPLFNKPGGGSAIPIKIGGRRTEPQFGLDMRRMFKRGNTP
jgi:AsmA-like protein